MKDVNLEIINRIKSLRTDNGLTQQQVANIIGTSRVNYNRYELGIRTIPNEIIDKLADFYKVSVDYIFGRED